MKLVIDAPDEIVEKGFEGLLTDEERQVLIRAIGNGTLYKERPRGEWSVTAEDNDGVHRICCPFCSYEKGSNNTDTVIVTFHNFPKFCENCGADMRKGGKE